MGRGSRGIGAHSCGGTCVPNSSSCDIGGHRVATGASRACSGESGEPGARFLTFVRYLLSTGRTLLGQDRAALRDTGWHSTPRRSNVTTVVAEPFAHPGGWTSTAARLLAGSFRSFTPSRATFALNRASSRIEPTSGSPVLRRHGLLRTRAAARQEGQGKLLGQERRHLQQGGEQRRRGAHRQPIADVVVPLLAHLDCGLVVELACGTVSTPRTWRPRSRT